MGLSGLISYMNRTIFIEGSDSGYFFFEMVNLIGLRWMMTKSKVLESLIPIQLSIKNVDFFKYIAQCQYQV